MAALIIGLVIVAVLAERWSLNHALDGVEYDVEPDRALVEIGERFSVITTLKNRSRRFIPFLRMVEDLPRDMETGLVTTRGAAMKEDRVNVRSTVGAGDSMVTGFLHGLALGEDLRGIFRRGVAAGTAAVTTEGTQLLTHALYQEMLDRGVIEEV